MKVWQLAALLAAGICGATMAAGQTKVDLSAQSKNVDFSQASSVRPFPTGPALPATCSIGQMFYLTGSPLPVQQCVAPNVWSTITGLSGNAILNVQRTSGTQLTIGSQCAAGTPCIFRIGSSLYSVTAPVTATLTGGSGVAYVYIDTNGNIVVGVSSSSATCSGCLVVTGTTQYPIGCIPLETWNATNGVWDPAGTNDIPLLSTPAALNAGANVTITQTGPAVTIAASGSSGGSGSGGGSGPTGTFYNPTDPTQWFRDHITLATGFNNGHDGWSYVGNCNAGSGSGATGFSSESILPTTWLSVTGANAGCFYLFPTTGNGAYGTGTFDYWSGQTPAMLYVAATYLTSDTNGTHYVGLSSGIGAGPDFIGCRQIGAGNWFAVIHVAGFDLATADTGIPHDTKAHRIVVDNASGTANTIRCSVDSSTPGVASAAIPAEPFGWNYVFGAVSAGTATNFAPFQYTIFLQGLPRL